MNHRRNYGRSKKAPKNMPNHPIRHHTLLKDRPLLLIEWLDASRLANSWMDWSEIPEPYPHKCVTAGFLVSENKHGKIVVPTIGDVEHTDNQHTYGGMLIPKSAIVSERRLK
jgi:hypothetical protein